MSCATSIKKIVDADLEANIDGLGRRSNLFWADFPLLRDMIRDSFEAKRVTAPSSF
jgi:hypothetical protein